MNTLHRTKRIAYLIGEFHTNWSDCSVSLALLWSAKSADRACVALSFKLDWLATATQQLVNDIDPCVHPHLQHLEISLQVCSPPRTYVDGLLIIQVKDFLPPISCTLNIVCLIMASGYAINPFVTPLCLA